MIIVGKDESIKTITQALALVTENNYTIFIKNGLYQEKLVIDKYVELIGEDKEQTIITFNDYARKLDEFGYALETFRTATVLILHNNVNLKSLTIRNDAGPGELVGQAVALFVNADNVSVTNCRIIAHQDTLLTGPIPVNAKNQEHLPFKIDHYAFYRQYFYDCLIQGDVDFIFGSANAFFINCTIVSNDLNKEINGYISAASTELTNIGHIFYQCKLISDARNESVYLGRPWRKYAHTVYIDCFMGKHINRSAFAKWDDKHLSARFFEFGSNGPGAFREDSLVKKLDKTEVFKYLELIENLIKK